jgi:Arc/MetJ-type ribon-helix-helix transcriptional regulator
MSKAENFTVRMGEDLKQRMKDHPEINWSHVIREHVQSMLDDVERMNELASDSKLNEEDIPELTNMINAAAAERTREDIEKETR